MNDREPVDVSTWDCMNCAGQLMPEQTERGDVVAICIDCGMTEVI